MKVLTGIARAQRDIAVDDFWAQLICLRPGLVTADVFLASMFVHGTARNHFQGHHRNSMRFAQHSSRLAGVQLGRLCSWHMFLTVAYGRLSTVLNRTCGAQNCAANVVGSFTFNVRLTKCTDKHSM